MGVEFNTWVEVINRHPLKYKFEGLDGERGSRGFYESVGDAAAHDEDFMSRWMADRAESEAKELGSEIEHIKQTGATPEFGIEADYIEWLREQEGEDDLTDLEILLDFDSKRMRDGFCGARQDSDDCQFEWKWLRSEDGCNYLLEKHPPIEVWDHAYEEGVELDKVLFLCPGCGRNPASEENEDLWGNYFNCGLCGSGTFVGDDAYLCLVDWCADLEVELYPFAPVKRESVLKEFSLLKQEYEDYVRVSEEAEQERLNFRAWWTCRVTGDTVSLYQLKLGV